MSYEKFIVEELISTPSGNYAQYTSNRGNKTMTKNFGYNVGDTVEVYDYDGYAPKRIDVNGKNIWSEENRVNWWKGYDPDAINFRNPYKKVGNDISE